MKLLIIAAKSILITCLAAMIFAQGYSLDLERGHHWSTLEIISMAVVCAIVAFAGLMAAIEEGGEHE